ncbi:superoxide dismutase [Ni] [Pontiella sp.]|uniref:superoxide dismutase [Ni] n=1 Tax=Pontiella sp. TaxID=2837462 RepID=UPI0035671E5B
MRTNTAKYWTIAVLFVTATAATVWAHCQIPCGIYDDQMRIHLMEEHVTTIEKSMKEIEAGQNQNQTVRWVMNKEEHADQLTEIATYYFLAQRIKPEMDHYEENLKVLHQLIVYSMKAKQTTDLKNVEKLKELIHELEHNYFGEQHKH